jgi:ribosome biogenesis GTPase
MAGNAEDTAALRGLPAALRGVIVEVQRRTAIVAGEGGAEYNCQYSPTIQLKELCNFAVGDQVSFIPQGPSQEPMITSVSPRTTQITRPGPKDRSADDLILAANVDTLLIVACTIQPEYNPRLVDRYLTLASFFGIDAYLCINKIDLDSALPAEVLYLRSLGYPVLPVSAKGGLGMDALRAALDGLTTVLSGASGVGKSSLIKALVPGADPRVGEVQRGKGKGRHTTTSSHLYHYAAPGARGLRIIDTPGIRELGIRVTRKELAALWRDIASLAAGCRFRDCVHTGEPGCAVTEAVERGALPAYRYDSYLRMLETLEK